MPSLIESLALLADPTRLRILLLLRQEELSVVELQEILKMGQSRISNHLAQLRQGGLVKDRRAGKNIYYALGEERHFADLLPVMNAAVHEIGEAAEDTTALRLAITKRHDKARDYFNKLAGKFGRTYCPGRTWEAVAHFLFLMVPPSTVVADLGAGEGTLSQLLAKRAKHVIAVDNSEKMVEFGSSLARQHGFSNLEYRLGDLENPPIDEGSVDIALLSQALHHAEHPDRAITAARRILKKGGRIVILDLLHHQFEEAREMYADRWLGFTEANMHQWLEAAGFREIEISIVARETSAPHFQTMLATGVS